MKKTMYAIVTKDEHGNVLFAKSNDRVCELSCFKQPFKLYTMKKYAEDLADKFSMVTNLPFRVVNIELEYNND